MTKEEKDKWYVSYQETGQNIVWTSFNLENDARTSYQSYKGNKAASMLYQYRVIEKDGD